MAAAFTCFTTDDRYQVQTLALLVGADRALARQLALDDLATNPHHQVVEVWDGGDVLFVVTRDDLAEV
jgi:hypothetical protein